MYYPKSQLKTNLFTNGEEYVYANTRIQYSGSYFKTGNGKIFTGTNPNNGPNNELLPVDNSSIPINDPNYVETLPESYYVIDEAYYYSKGVNYNYLGTPPPLPIQQSPQPTEQNYGVGEFQRYFLQKANEKFYLETTNSEAKKYLEKSPSVMYQLYTPFSLPWVLTGDREEVYNINLKTVHRVQKSRKLVGFESYFRGRYDQFYKETPTK